MKKSIFIILSKSILLSLFVANLCFPQNSFIKTYSGIAVDGNSLVQTSDSGFVIFGYTAEYQAILLRTDKNGDTLWTKKYGTIQEYPDLKYSLKKTLDKGYILGYRNNLIRTDDSGNVVWNKKFNSIYILNVESSLDSGFVFTGSLYDNNWAYIYLMKVNQNGDSLWMKRYDNSQGAFADGNYVQATSDSGYIITGYVSLQNSEIYVIKTNGFGDTLWTKTYGGFYDEGYSGIQTKDNNYFITGHYTVKPCEFCELFYHTWLLKLNSEGDTIWTKRIAFGYEDRAWIGRQTSDGGYIITGYKYSIETTQRLFVAKLNEFGDTLWTKTLIDEVIGDSQGYDIIETNDGGYAIKGCVTYYNGQRDMLLLKLNKDGNITAIDYDEEDLALKEFLLDQNYPNPFNPTTTIKYQIPTPPSSSPLAKGRNEVGFVTLKVYDILGEEVATLVNEEKAGGKYEVNFSATSGASQLASGVYIYTLRVNNFVSSKKMILLR